MKKSIAMICIISVILGLFINQNIQISSDGIQLNFTDNTGYWIEF